MSHYFYDHASPHDQELLRDGLSAPDPSAPRQGWPLDAQFIFFKPDARAFMSAERTLTAVAGVFIFIKPDTPLPTEAQLKEWFDALTNRQKVTISGAFRDRKRAQAFAEEQHRKNRAAGTVDFTTAAGAADDRYSFVDPHDVFISPRDHQHFEFATRTPPQTRRKELPGAEPFFLVRERQGIVETNRTYLDQERERLSIGGQCDMRKLVERLPDPATK